MPKKAQRNWAEMPFKTELSTENEKGVRIAGTFFVHYLLKEITEMRSNEIIDTMGANDRRPVTSVLGKKEPIAHPTNCSTECAYGRGRAFCFPCMALILSERRSAGKS